MIWILVFIIIAFFFYKGISDPWDNTIGEKVLFWILSIILSGCMSIILLGITSMCLIEVVELEYTKTSDIEIVALQDNQNINGNFYIFSNNINYYYAIEDEFGYKVKKVSMKEAYIKYTNGTPYIEVYSAEFANWWNYIFGVSIAPNIYIIYCPEGTLVTNYNIDL